MGRLSPYHWLVVAAWMVYVWLLIKISKPKAVANPVFRTNTTRSRLTVQTTIAWLCALIFGLWTFLMVVTSATRPSAAPGDTSGHIADLVFDLGVPLLFALSVRWTRNVMRTWKALRMGQP